jgi:hypothetical protein
LGGRVGLSLEVAMNTLVLLIVLVITDGGSHYFVAETESMSDCAFKQTMAVQIVPKLTVEKPLFWSASCGLLVPYTTAT